ncbi:MAG TPA: LptA/OstA family protein [Steroidobacteraceae bacterium]|jgi:lipopolysaccharide transport protein LptA|nr:LptA/OstA family protein [Steroidobacteraceae bacterium]
MRRFHAESLAALTIALCSSWAIRLPAATATPAPSTTADNQCREVMCLDGDGPLELDPTHMTLRHFTIVYPQRGTTLTGDLAQGEMPAPNSRDMRWVLTGHVEITLPQGHLTADKATMQVINGGISAVTAEGTPAKFDRGGGTATAAGQSPAIPAALEHAYGHARTIIYDLDRGQLELHGDSYLSNGCYEFSSEHMSYDIINQRIQADPHEGGGVHGKITRDRNGGGNCPGSSIGSGTGNSGTNGGNKP